MIMRLGWNMSVDKYLHPGTSQYDMRNLVYMAQGTYYKYTHLAEVMLLQYNERLNREIIHAQRTIAPYNRLWPVYTWCDW